MDLQAACGLSDELARHVLGDGVDACYGGCDDVAPVALKVAWSAYFIRDESRPTGGGCDCEFDARAVSFGGNRVLRRPRRSKTTSVFRQVGASWHAGLCKRSSSESGEGLGSREDQLISPGSDGWSAWVVGGKYAREPNIS